jgi:hypothetical protein
MTEDETVSFDTRIAIVIRDDLAPWQGLNVACFLTSGIVGATEGMIGEPYVDASGTTYHALAIQPIMVLAADLAGLRRVHERAQVRGVKVAVYIEDMFATGHDGANRATVRKYPSGALPLVGVGLRAERKIVDKVTKGTSGILDRSERSSDLTLA